MGYRELIRRKFLEDVYNKMSDEEKLTFVRLTMQNADAKDIKNALNRQQEQLNRIEKGQNWKVDFLSDVSANFLTDGLIWLGSKIMRKL